MTNKKKTKGVRGKRKGKAALTIGQIAEAIEKTGGFLTYAAKELNVTPAAITHRLKKSSTLRKKLKEVKYGLLDLSEVSLIKKIKAGDLGAICFYLKCKGKERGYIEKQILQHEGELKTESTIKMVKYTPKELLEEMKKRGLPLPENK